MHKTKVCVVQFTGTITPFHRYHPCVFSVFHDRDKHRIIGHIWRCLLWFQFRSCAFHADEVIAAPALSLQATNRKSPTLTMLSS